MSLKVIKELVEAVARGDHPERLLAKASATIAALEKAAKILTDDEVKRALRHAPDDVQDTIEWLATIAKEAE